MQLHPLIQISRVKLLRGAAAIMVIRSDPQLTLIPFVLNAFIILMDI